MDGKNNAKSEKNYAFSTWIPFRFPLINADSNVNSGNFDSVSHVDRPLFSPPEGETGLDRIKMIFREDQFGNLSPECALIVNTTFGALFVGGLMGIFYGGKIAQQEYLERQQATAFRNEYEAKRALQDRMTIGMGKGFVKWGLRTSAFTAMYMSSVTMMSVYRGKSGIIEHVIGGGVAGLSYKFLQGPRASLVGGFVGGVLGLITGCLSLVLMRSTGMTIEEIRHWHYSVRSLHSGRSTVVKDELSENLSTEMKISDAPPKASDDVPQ